MFQKWYFDPSDLIYSLCFAPALVDEVLRELSTCDRKTWADSEKQRTYAPGTQGSGWKRSSNKSSEEEGQEWRFSSGDKHSFRTDAEMLGEWRYIHRQLITGTYCLNLYHMTNYVKLPIYIRICIFFFALSMSYVIANGGPRCAFGAWVWGLSRCRIYR